MIKLHRCIFPALGIAALLALAPCAAEPAYDISPQKLTVTAVNGTDAHITSLDTSASGCLEIPAVIGGYRITGIADGAFKDCDKLLGVKLNEPINYIGASAFESCVNLEFAVIPDTVSRISPYAFAYCRKLESIRLPQSLSYVAQGAFTSCTSLDSLLLPDSVTRVDERAFENCSSLRTVVTGGELREIGAFSFSGCASLREVAAAKSEIRTIGRCAFSGCVSLRGVRFNNGLMSLGAQAFAGCTSLARAELAFSLGTVGYRAFAGCCALSSVTHPGEIYTIGDGAFSGCTSLTALDYGGSSSINYRAVNGSLLTSDGKRLISAPLGVTGRYIVPDGVEVIEDGAFYGAVMTSVVLPDSVLQIGRGAFALCTRLRDINLGGVREIEGCAFYGCLSLGSVFLPESVEKIAYGAFADCPRLTAVYHAAAGAAAGVDSFSDGGITFFTSFPFSASGANASVSGTYLYCGDVTLFVPGSAPVSAFYAQLTRSGEECVGAEAPLKEYLFDLYTLSADGASLAGALVWLPIPSAFDVFDTRVYTSSLDDMTPFLQSNRMCFTASDASEYAVVGFGPAGDVNRDSTVNGADIIRLRKLLDGACVYVEQYLADLNRDGEADADDLPLLLQRVRTADRGVA